MLKRFSQKHTGFTLVEMVVYLSILALLLIVVVTTVLSVARSYMNAKLLADVDRAGAIAMERLVREIRQAESVDTGQSTLGSSSGRLVMNTTDASGNATTVDFYLNLGVLKLKEGGVYTGPLTASTTSVTAFTLTSLTGAYSNAVKIDMTITATQGAVTKTETFHDTIVMRGSYH